MSLLFPLHPGPSNTVRVLADAGRTAAAAMSMRRTAAPMAVVHVPGNTQNNSQWDTYAPLPFHLTGGQPIVGQGVVIHMGERDTLLANMILLLNQWPYSIE
ncbi:unnamed protein product [Spirodela intermedia]|uniref:Uncharacterized protein n=1 Tax=Spirodela intermedia TaxID=51605 RepID=A0ABN7E8P5_SPIIN|nr:unnamed protein product [Spirodela intermedia]